MKDLWSATTPGFRLFVFLVLFLIGVLAGTDAFATDQDDGDCNHPRFVERGCELPGPAGPAGPQGEQGPQGPQGERGPAGVVPTKWLEDTRLRFGRFASDIAVTNVLDADLARVSGSRMTVTGASIAGVDAIGLGYSYMDKDGVALKIAVGVAEGHARALKVGFSWEF